MNIYQQEFDSTASPVFSLSFNSIVVTLFIVYAD